MKIGKIIKTTLITILATSMAAYIVYAVFFLSMPDENEKCQTVELIVNQETQSVFIDEKDVETMLKDANLYPKGMLMKDVDTERIETTIKKNEFILSAECYKATEGVVCISVTQRTPTLYVLPDGREGFFLDTKGIAIPNSRGYMSDFVVVSGDVDETFASKNLVDIGMFLRTDAFWSKQIEQIYLTRNDEGERVVEIVPRVGDQIVYLGTLDNFQKKLRNLRIFYDKAMGTVGWNKYKRINLEYDNQIICTKRNKSKK